MKQKSKYSSVFQLKYQRLNLLKEQQIDSNSQAFLLRYVIGQEMQMANAKNKQALWIDFTHRLSSCVNPFELRNEDRRAQMETIIKKKLKKHIWQSFDQRNKNSIHISN